MRINRTLGPAAVLISLPQAGAAADATAHPWAVPTSGLQPSAHFANLADRDTVESLFVVKFGPSLLGLVPVGMSPRPGGHHHLLVNQHLP